MTPKTKVCTKCGKEKAIQNFYVSNESKDGRKNSCKQCHREYMKNRRRTERENNPEYMAEQELKEKLARDGTNICTVCKEEKPREAFVHAKRYSWKTKKETVVCTSHCKACRKLYRQLLAKDKKGVLTERSRIIGERHKAKLERQVQERKRVKNERKRQYAREYTKRPYVKQKAWNGRRTAYYKAYQKVYRARLPDAFIRRLLCQGTLLTSADIPQDLIELKRQHILLGRLLKENKHDKTQSDNERIARRIGGDEQKAQECVH